MKLIYKLNFRSTNSYFKEIIDELIAEFKVNASTQQYKGFIVILMDDEENKINGFFKHVEENLPLSIFLLGGEVIESIDEKLEKFETAVSDKKQNIAIKASEVMRIYETSTEFQSEAQALKSGEIVKIETSNGIKEFALATPENREILGGDVNLLVVNLNDLRDLLVLSPKDVQLLSSVERPLVKLKFNILRNKNKEYSSTNFVYTKLPDDEVTYKLATALRKEDINFLIYKEQALQEDLKVTYSDDKTIIISGDKALFPKYDYILKKEYQSSKEYFEENGGVFKATLSQFNKRVSSSIGIYFSMKSDESEISVNVPGKGITPIIKIPNVETCFENCIEDIEGIDENTPRLIASYKKNFPEVFATAPTLENTNGFETILNLTAHMIGLENARAFEDKAFEFNAKSGINIDFRIVKIDDTNYLDYRRVIQSIMSYKAAGVNDAMLAFSFYESLSEFITDNIATIKGEINCNDVVLCGDMFANSNLLSKTTKALKAYNIIIPSEYPLDVTK